MKEASPAPFGHMQARERLYGDLPPAVLLLGPESTGKWLLARHIATVRAPWFALMELRSMTVSQARDVPRFLETFPSALHAKFVLIDLDGVASGEALQALLKCLEEPPEYARFILTASKPPLATIASRCEIIRTGYLEDGQVAQVLAANGISEADALAIAPAGQGQVAPALSIAARFRPAKASVLGVIRALATRDRELLGLAVKDWGDTEDWLLRELLRSAASGKPTTLFSSTEQMLLGKTAARKALALLDRYRSARPEMRIRALAAGMTERK